MGITSIRKLPWENAGVRYTGKRQYHHIQIRDCNNTVRSPLYVYTEKKYLPLLVNSNPAYLQAWK